MPIYSLTYLKYTVNIQRSNSLSHRLQEGFVMSDSLSALQLNNQNSSDNDIPLSYLKRLIDCGIIDLNGVAENIMTTTKV